MRKNVDEDYRRCLFRERLRILEKLNPEWADKERQKIEMILKKHPYDDYNNARTEYCKSLISQGENHDRAYDKALQKYPIGKL